MVPYAKRGRRAQRAHEACTGCSLCLLACPVWRATRDIRLTPHGRAKALQHGASAPDLAASIEACTLCGSCEPACPEDIALMEMIVGLRAELARRSPERVAGIIALMQARNQTEPAPGGAAECLVPDTMLLADAPLLERAARLLGGLAVAADEGSDIAQALEAGADIPESRLDCFLSPLRGARRLVVADGLLVAALRAWLPGARVESLGEAASSTAAVRMILERGDYYVIEARAYHADRERLVRHYDALRLETGCGINLDLQRLAIPTTAGSLPERLGRNRVDVRAQAQWIIEGREFSRIVVEDLNDIAAFRGVTDKPVVHLVHLAELA
jgi:NAD-dependent dihydropyrimidine dehydrogenase PreA subunit